MTISSFDTSAYIFECSCGERFKTVLIASACKKCRSYSVWGYTKYVVNTQTGEVVHGEMPSDEEYAEAAAAAEQRWAAEQAEWQLQKEEDERRWWEQEEAAKQEAVKAATEAEEDLLWAIQDHLMSR
jgi:hypothetical protein